MARQENNHSDGSIDGFDRRRFLRTAGAGGAIFFAGCAGGDGGDGGTGGDDGGDSGTTGGNGGDGGTTGGNGGETLRIGALLPLSGPTSNIGSDKKRGFELAKQVYNDQGGIDGTTVEVVYGDTQGEPAQAVSAANSLISQEEVDVLGGGYHSDNSLAVLDVSKQNDFPFVIDESISGQITTKINENNIQGAFKTTPPGKGYAVNWRLIFEYLQGEELGYFPYENKEVAMIAEDTSYGSSVMENTVTELEKIGWTTVSKDSVALDRSNFTSLLSRIKSRDPDVVWQVGTSSSVAATLVKQFRNAGFKQTHFMSNFGMTVDTARENAGAAGDGVITTIIPTAIPSYLKEVGMQPAWEDEYGGTPSGSAASSYQNVLLITKLANAAGGPSAFPDIDIGEWESAVIDHDPITGACGVYDWKDNHQAKWGTVDTQPGIAYQVLDQELRPFWPSELTDQALDESVY